MVFLGGVVILYMAFSSKEVPFKEEEIKPKLWESIRDLFLNKKFWISGFANAFYSAAMSLVMAALPFFVKYTLKIPSWSIDHSVCLSFDHRYWRCFSMGLAGAEILPYANLAGCFRLISGGVYPFVFCQFPGHSHHRQRAGWIWFFGRDHYHGFDRCQSDG